MSLTLALNNANLLTIERVVDFITGPITDMEGLVTIYDQNDTDVLAGCDSLPIAFTTTWDDKEIYYVVIPATVQIIEGTRYRGRFVSTNYEVDREIELTGVRMLIK